MAEEGKSLLNKQQRKKAARKQRKQNERAAHRNLDDVTGKAIEQALALVPLTEREVAIDVALASVSEAEFVRKRVNEALRVGEWLDEVRVRIWQADSSSRAALTEGGRVSGIELRLALHI